MVTELISVIIPVYKVEGYLDKCVESIVNQTYKNLEIILVDDGSPDNCPYLCDEWAKKDERIRVIHKQNGGLSDARNAGMLDCSGDFVYFIDSDDTLIKTAIESAVEQAKINDADVVISTLNTRKYDGQILVGNGPQIFKKVMTDARWEACGKLFKRGVISDLLFKKGRLYEDVLFTPIVILRAKKAVFMNDGAYLYTQREDSIMGKSKQVVSEDLSTNVNELLEIIGKEYKSVYHFAVLWGATFLRNKTKEAADNPENKPFLDAAKKYARKHFVRLLIFNKYGIHFRFRMLKMMF